MTTFDQFVVDDESVTAEPSDGSDPVTFSVALFERTGTVAGWETLVEDWIDSGDGSLSFDGDGHATLSRERVLSATAASPSVAVGGRRGAEAVLARLVDEEVVTVDDDSVTVLRPLDQLGETHAAVFHNWAAAVSVLVERLDRLVARLEAVWSIVPESDQPATTGAVDAGTVGELLERLGVARDIFVEHRDDLRELALGSTVFPEPSVEEGDVFTTLAEFSLDVLPTATDLATTADPTAVEIAERIADRYAGCISSLLLRSPAKKMEDESLDEFLEDVGDEVGETPEPDADEIPAPDVDDVTLDDSGSN